ncbi:hypothetical protein HDU98_004314 [Podochytrium sp. JEL0797]|nr:hypothetical protein HDU98_004314 [Podochytrium sp. JEL0797]
MDPPPLASPTTPRLSGIALKLATKRAALEEQLRREEEGKVTALPVEVNPHEMVDEDQLEKEARDMRKQLDEATTKAASADRIASELVQERMNLKSAEEAISAHSATIAQLQRTTNEQTASIERMEQLVTAKQKESDDQNESIRQLQHELESLSANLTERSQQTQSSQSDETRFRIQNLEWEKEKHELTKNVDWLNAELERRAVELKDFRESKATEVAELKQSVDALTQQKVSLEQKSVSLEEKSNANDARISDLVSKLADSESRFNKSQETFQTELNVQQSLANLYKSKSEEHAHRMQECLQLAHAAQEETDNAIRSRIEMEQSLVDVKKALEKRDEQIEELESRVNAMKESGVSSLAVLNPASQLAMTGQKTGKTFTEIYAEYSDLKEENLRLKSETFRLNENLNSIVADIQERAPLIKQMVADKRNLTTSVHLLTTQLSASKQQHQTAQSSISNLQNIISSLESTHKAVETESKTLSNQVQHLLIQLETLRSGGAAPTEPNDLSNSVAEMQSENTRQRVELQTCREIITKLETENASLVRMRAVTVEVEQLRTECGKLKESLRVSELKAGSYKRERDQIKWLLDNNKENEGKVVEGADVVGGGGEFEAMYKRLQVEFDEFRNETGTDTQALKETNEALLKAKNELEIHVVKLNSALDHLQGKFA